MTVLIPFGLMLLCIFYISFGLVKNWASLFFNSFNSTYNIFSGDNTINSPTFNAFITFSLSFIAFTFKNILTFEKAKWDLYWTASLLVSTHLKNELDFSFPAKHCSIIHTNPLAIPYIFSALIPMFYGNVQPYLKVSMNCQALQYGCIWRVVLK